MDLFRETLFGRLVHSASGGGRFKRDEELDPSIMLLYTPGPSPSSSRSNFKESLDGTLRGKDSEESLDDREKRKDSEESLDDREKRKVERLVQWAVNDPHNPRNWSTFKKVFVTFQICFLTTSVYIGSAIYSASIPGIMPHFQVSETKALLGLTLFVLGYALGPMVWVRRLPISLVNWMGLINMSVGAHVGNPLYWPKPYLHRNPICIRSPPARRDIREKLLNASSIPIYHWLCWKPCSSYRRGHYCRLVQAFKADLQYCDLGNFSGTRSSHGSTGWRLCR